MKKIEAMTDERFRGIGRLHGSEDVALEASETSARWHRDVEGLAAFGFGPDELAEFDRLREEHRLLREARPQAVAIKVVTIEEYAGRVEASQVWVDQVVGVIGRLARRDAAIAARLNAALPADKGALGASLGAPVTLLTDVRARLPATAAVDARLAEAPALIEALTHGPGTVSTAKAAPVEDTAEIDILDGKLYVPMKDVNEGARKAIRAKAITASRSEYRFHHLGNRGGKKTTAPTPPPPPPPAMTPASGTGEAPSA
jgi:hypothetical protein